MNDAKIVIYQSEDGKTKIQTQLENETLWLTQENMSELFQKSRSTINEHIKNIYNENELSINDTMKKFGNSEFAKKPTNYYNLEMIIAVGYRVKSTQGTQFRKWATAVLKEYVVKGFAMNDEMLKEQGGGDYFDELLARIRDIRSSEKVFYRKVLDIYETSIDYDPKAEESIVFFKTIQNKMHYATHGKTAAEIIFQRADSTALHMGLTSFKGNKPNKQEVKIAKNYLTEDELDTLNRIVNMYLEFAELQAKMKKKMYMNDWIKKLDTFLNISDLEVLKNKGLKTHKQAVAKAVKEYEVYNNKTKDELTKIEKDFIQYIEHSTKELKGSK